MADEINEQTVPATSRLASRRTVLSQFVRTMISGANLSGLPLEVLEEIGRQLGDEKDISSLVRTNRRLCHLLAAYLYRVNLQRRRVKGLRLALQGSPAECDSRLALEWAARRGRLDIIQRAMRLGIRLDDDPEVLATAVRYGHEGVVKFVLETNQVDVNALVYVKDDGHAYGVDAWTPLCIATYKGYTGIMRMLLEHGAHILDCGEFDGGTQIPMAVAAMEGHLAAVKLLFEYGAGITYGAGLIPALNLASRFGHTELARLLLEAGAPLDGAVNDAAVLGHCELATLLLDAGAPIDGALNQAVAAGHYELAKLLIERGASLGPYRGATRSLGPWIGRSPLTCAAITGNIELLQLLIDHGADIEGSPNEPRDAPLLGAVEHNSVAAVELLLEQGARVTNMNGGNRTPLQMACYGGTPAIVEMLLNCGAIIDEQDPSREVLKPMVYKAAAMSSLYGSPASPDRVQVVKALIKHGARVEQINVFGSTALTLASMRGEVRVAQLFLDLGATTAVANCAGRSALHAACRGIPWAATSNNHAKVVQMLLENNADASRADNNGRSALFYAATRGNSMALSAILSHSNLSGNFKDFFGTMPIIAAARCGHTAVVKALLAADSSSLKYRDSDGRDLLWWASKSGNKELLAFLLENTQANSLSVPEPDAFEELNQSTVNEGASVCDICTRCSIDVATSFRCIMCDGGVFLICGGCQAAGAQCRDVSHTWEPCSTYTERLSRYC